jgi:hypothetical protein
VLLGVRAIVMSLPGVEEESQGELIDKEITGETERLRSEEASVALTELGVVSPRAAIDRTVIASESDANQLLVNLFITGLLRFARSDAGETIRSGCRERERERETERGIIVVKITTLFPLDKSLQHTLYISLNTDGMQLVFGVFVEVSRRNLEKSRFL